MTKDDGLSIQELIEGYKEYMGSQANEIVVLKTIIKRLEKELEEVKSELEPEKEDSE
jgi:archaellum component FlaC